MTGPDRPVRQPANTRASVLLTCSLRLAAFPCTPATRTLISARGSDRERRTPRARPMRTIPSSTFRGRFLLLRRDPVGGSSGRSVVHTPRHWETGRPRAAQFAPWAVYIPGGGVVRKEGAQDGDSRWSLTGAGRGWRGVPGAGRVLPAGAAGALLPDARILRRRRGRRPGDDAGRLARHRRVHRGTRVAAHLAVQDRHQPVPQRAPRGEPAPGQGVGYVAVRTARADAARRGRLAAAVS